MALLSQTLSFSFLNKKNCSLPFRKNSFLSVSLSSRRHLESMKRISASKYVAEEETKKIAEKEKEVELQKAEEEPEKIAEEEAPSQIPNFCDLVDWKIQATAGNSENMKDDLSGLDKAIGTVLGKRTIERVFSLRFDDEVMRFQSMETQHYGLDEQCDRVEQGVNMIGYFLTRGLVLAFGYLYPAYECYKSVEMNKIDIEQLRFWCQYLILVAGLTVCERIGDMFIGWIPMYGEAKLAFFVYLWFPKTKGATYVYDSFFRPYVAKHETEINRTQIELRTRAGDMALLYWQKSLSYTQSRTFDILQYIASQSTAKRPAQIQEECHRRLNSSTSVGSMPACRTK